MTLVHAKADNVAHGQQGTPHLVLLRRHCGGCLSALWGHVSKLLLQRREEKSKKRLAGLEAELKQKYAKIESDLRLSQNLLQAKIDRSVFVTKAHFDTEFEAIEQVFGLLAKVSLCINGIRPMVGIGPNSDTYREMFGTGRPASNARHGVRRSS